MKKITTFLFFLTTLASASPLEESLDFFDWLEQHAKDFAACDVTKEGGYYILCDKTQVPQGELKRLFALKPEDLIADLKGKGLKVELVCAPADERPLLGSECVTSSNNKMFSEVTSLHGKYVPESKMILIRNSASPGSLIHEYIHFLQSDNSRPIYGHVYKKERNEVQGKLAKLMDEKISIIQKLEKSGQRDQTQAHLKEFMLASEATRSFAPWQDLIDERGIFRIYIKYGADFGASAADIALAKKNMKFICKNPKLSKLVPSKQCL